MTEKELAKKIAYVLDEKKGEQIKIIEITELSIIADYMVIVNGTSNTHVRALADEVEYELGKLGVEPHHIEGRATGWILLDYSTVLVHVFTPDSRDYFNLEKLWADGKIIEE